MDDSGVIASDDGGDNLVEVILGHGVVQRTAILDNLAEIHARLHALHDDDELFASVAEIQQADDSVYVAEFAEQATLERHFDTINLFFLILEVTKFSTLNHSIWLS